MKKIFLILALSSLFSCQTTHQKKYAEVFYTLAPGLKLPMDMYCKCISINDTVKKQFEHSFEISGDSLSNFLKNFEKLQPSNSKNSFNARVFILVHNSETTDTICAGYDGGIKFNSRAMRENQEFTKEVMTLVSQHHSKIMSKKFRKQ